MKLLIPRVYHVGFKGGRISLLPTYVDVNVAFVVVISAITQDTATTRVPVSILATIVNTPFFVVLVQGAKK